MTIQEVCNDIRKSIKPYVGLMAQSRFSNTLRSIEAGLCKPKTTTKFFNALGYEGEFNEWQKVESIVHKQIA
jgi:hypothetical protein